MSPSRLAGLALAPLALAALAAARPANAQTLTFEGLKDQESVGSYYAGGTGGSGSGPGANYGITFTSNALAIISDQAGGNGNFDKNAPPSGSTALFFLNGAAATLNDPAGFNTGFSFYYSAINQPGFIKVYSGLNDTGTVLATLNLPVTSAVPSGRFQPFVPIGVAFNGTAESVDFGGTVNQIAFDNITINSVTPGSAVPEPSTVASFGVGGLGVLGLLLRARRKPRASA